jgi:hypothetical protein
MNDDNKKHDNNSQSKIQVDIIVTSSYSEIHPSIHPPPYLLLIMSVLQKLNDYIVEATEQALKVVEEGSAILMSGGMDSPQESNNDGTGDFDRDTDATTQEHSDFSGDIPEDYFEQGSPLNGLADNVLSDVMKNQVS